VIKIDERVFTHHYDKQTDENHRAKDYERYATHERENTNLFGTRAEVFDLKNGIDDE